MKLLPSSCWLKVSLALSTFFAIGCQVERLVLENTTDPTRAVSGMWRFQKIGKASVSTKDSGNLLLLAKRQFEDSTIDLNESGHGRLTIQGQFKDTEIVFQKEDEQFIYFADKIQLSRTNVIFDKRKGTLQLLNKLNTPTGRGYLPAIYKRQRERF